MKIKTLIIVVVWCAACRLGLAQDVPGGSEGGFASASISIRQQLEESLKELAQLRQKAADEKIPLSRALRERESALAEARQAYQQTSRLLDSRTLDLSNLRTQITSRKDEATYVSNLLSEYVRNCESRSLHIAELHRYRKQLEEARLATENSALSQQEVFHAQAAMVETSLMRLEEALGGTRFEGTAVDGGGRVRNGTFLMIGPAALFESADHAVIGTAETRLGSLEPAVIPFDNPIDMEAARAAISGIGRVWPLDPTLGNAHVIEATRDTFIEHVKKGGPLMIPIFVLAGAALLVVLYKWLALVFVRTPGASRVHSLLAAVARHDQAEALRLARAMRGPAGEMLTAGVEHLREPRELIEEVMFEVVLTARLKLQRLLPFVAISASSAPLLGLLGTVTGIINTFNLITVFGSGDMKTLSGGISEALITTEYGLYVAIPSLLLHAFLSRKAKAVSDQMEKIAVAFLNQVSRTRSSETNDTIQSRPSEELDGKSGRPASRKGTAPPLTAPEAEAQPA